ncbi:MAG: GNAT family N-acetyltransferase [Eggerthellaceae bacterium]
MLEFAQVKTSDDLEYLAKIAREIWMDYWPPIIGREQTEYMIDKFHSVEAMTTDIEEHGYRFWLLRNEQGECVGYTGGAAEIVSGNPQEDAAIIHNQVVHNRWKRRFFISKVYLFTEQRGKHYSSEVLAFYRKLCEQEGLDAMYLTVNVNNKLGIRAYEGNGFTIVDKHASPIGKGFVMDDYIMAKEIQ